MPNWNAEARRAVEHIQSELSEAHRGAFLWYEPEGVVLVFNNGLYEHLIAEKQMRFLKRAFELRGARIRVLSHSEDGASWAMLITGVEPGWAHDCIWAAWHSAWSQVDPLFAPLDVSAFVERGDLPLNSDGRYQYRVAQEIIAAHFPNPGHWKNCRSEDFTVDPRLPEFEQTGGDLVGDAEDDRLLAKRCLAGEVAAWEELYGRFHGPLCTAISGMLGPGGSDLSRVDEIAARVWYALVRNDGELLNRFDAVRHTRLGEFLRGLARIEIMQYFSCRAS